MVLFVVSAAAFHAHYFDVKFVKKSAKPGAVVFCAKSDSGVCGERACLVFNLCLALDMGIYM